MNNSSQIPSSIYALRRVLIVFGTIAFLVIIILAFRTLFHLCLLYFTSIIIALVLGVLTNWLKKLIPVHQVVALGIVIIVIVALILIFGYLIGPRIVSESTHLVDTIRQGIAKLQQYGVTHRWAYRLLSFLRTPTKYLPSLIGGVRGVFQNTLSFLSGVIFLLLMSVFLAANPELYIDNAIRLFYPQRREIIRETVSALAFSLRRWLLGRFIAMLMIGVFTTLALLVFRVPLALPLGIIAGILDFIPFIGPIVSAVPAILVTLATDPVKSLWIIVIYLGVHLLEDLITPVIQWGVARIPPALLVSVQVFLALLGGIFGVLIAEPLTLTIIVIIQIIYFRNYLKEKIRVLGEREK